jgi:hypothetical protein
MEDDMKPFQTKEEFIKKDPILRPETELSDQGTLSKAEIYKIRQAVSKEIEAAVDVALQSEPPDAAALTADVYCPEDKNLYCGSFDPGSPVRELSVAQAVNKALAQEMKRDKRVFMWGEDISLAGFNLLKAAPVKIAAPECPIPYAKNLENAMQPSVERVAGKIKEALN